MFAVDHEILIAALLLFVGILSSKLSPRLGLPMLVLFLAVGMLAGEAGIGGIAFDDTHTAHALGTLALAVILFDGGLQTSVSAIKSVWKTRLAAGHPGCGCHRRDHRFCRRPYSGHSSHGGTITGRYRWFD